jgi:rod shape-determining protein MreC
MRRFLFLLQVYREYVLLAVLIAVSITLFPLNDNPQIKQLRAYSIGGLGLLHEPVTMLTETVTLRAENERLRRANIQLADEVYQLREARLENIRLRRMVQFQERSPYELVPARVVGQSVDPLRRTITLNAGRNAGIREQMPIVSESGLVGRVIIAADNYSIGQVLLNRDFRTSAKVERTRVDGILQWDGGTGLLLNNIAKTLDVNEGDVVITSEYSNLFPPGIFIGVISRVNIIPGSVTKDIRIQPGVDFTRLEEVFIMLYETDEEKITLEERIQQR